MFHFPLKDTRSVMEYWREQFFLPAIALCGMIVGTCCTGCRQSPEQNAVPVATISPKVLAASGMLGGKISRALTGEPKLRGTYIIVGVSNLDGGVLLSGHVGNAAQEKLAIRLAKTQAGNAKVVSRIQTIRSGGDGGAKKASPPPKKH